MQIKTLLLVISYLWMFTPSSHAVATNAINRNSVQPSITPPVPYSKDMRAYQAKYTARSSKLPISATAIHTLHKLPDGRAELTTYTQALLSELTETSVMHWQNCQSQSQRYEYSRQVFNTKVRYQQQFPLSQSNAKQPQFVAYLHDQQTTQVALPSNRVVDDRLLSQLKVRCLVKSGEKQFTLNVLNKDQIKPQSFQVKTAENLSLPIGDITAVKVERLRDHKSKYSTTVWLAPQWDYLPVKVIQDNDGEVLTLELIKVEFSAE